MKKIALTVAVLALGLAASGCDGKTEDRDLNQIIDIGEPDGGGVDSGSGDDKGFEDEAPVA